MLRELPENYSNDNSAQAEYVYRHGEMDLSPIAAHFDIPYAVKVSSEVYDRYIAVSAGEVRTEVGRMFDFFTALKQASIGCRRAEFRFPLLALSGSRVERVTLLARLSDTGEDGEPVLTVSL